jgi:hypothetical protein
MMFADYFKSNQTLVSITLNDVLNSDLNKNLGENSDV